MNVEQLIKILEQYPKDLPVTICDISDDGDGDGYAPLRDIIEVSSEMVESTDDDKEHEVVLLMYNGYGNFTQN